MSRVKNKLRAILGLGLALGLAAKAPKALGEENSGASSSVAGVGSSSPLRAQNNKFVLDFDDELVKGKAVNPGVDFVFVRGQFNGKKLIRLRDNFLPEIENGKQEFSGKK